MLLKNQYVVLRSTLAVRALKGRSSYQLGVGGMKFRVVKPHEKLAGYFYMRQNESHNHPPMSVIHFTEVLA